MMFSPSAGTLAPRPAPLPRIPSMGFGALFGVFVGHKDSELPCSPPPPVFPAFLAWGLGSYLRPGQDPRPQAGVRAAEGGPGLVWALVFLPLLVSMSLLDKTLNDFCLL